MNVRRVPSLVVVFREEPFHYPTRELFHGDTAGIREFCEKLATSATTVPKISNQDQLQNFIERRRFL